MAAEIPQPLTDAWEKFRTQPAVIQGLEILGATAVALELDKTLQPHLEQLLHQTHVAWADAVQQNGGRPLTLSQIGDVIKSGLTRKGPYATEIRPAVAPLSEQAMPQLQRVEPPQPPTSSPASPTRLGHTGPIRSAHGPDVGSPNRATQLTTAADSPVIEAEAIPVQVTSSDSTPTPLPWWRQTYSMSDHINGIRQLNDSVNSWHQEHVAQPLSTAITAVKDWHNRRSPVNPDGRLTRAVKYVFSPYHPEADTQPSRLSVWRQQRRSATTEQPEQVTIISPSRSR